MVRPHLREKEAGQPEAFGSAVGEPHAHEPELAVEVRDPAAERLERQVRHGVPCAGHLVVEQPRVHHLQLDAHHHQALHGGGELLQAALHHAQNVRFRRDRFESQNKLLWDSMKPNQQPLVSILQKPYHLTIKSPHR